MSLGQPFHLPSGPTSAVTDGVNLCHPPTPVLPRPTTTQGTQLDQEAFSAFSGSVLPQTSPEIPLALGLDQDRPVVVDGVASESEDEDDLARFLIGLGVDRVCVVGLAMDYW